MVTHNEHHYSGYAAALCIEAAGRNRGRRPSWGPKGQKWRPQADTEAKIKRTLSACNIIIRPMLPSSVVHRHVRLSVLAWW